MNKKQKFVIWVSLVIFVTTALASPWSVGRQIRDTNIYNSTIEFGPVFASPPVWGANFIQLAWQQLLCEWLALGIFCSTLVLLLKSKPKADS